MIFMWGVVLCMYLLKLSYQTLKLDQLWFTIMVSICCKGKFPWWGGGKYTNPARPWRILFFFNIYFYFVCIGALSACISVHNMNAVPLEAGVGIWNWWCLPAEHNLTTSGRPDSALTTELSLLPLYTILDHSCICKWYALET